ncbi:DUF1129 family protein [Alkalihalobacillus hemicellulosilyticus]|uniref:Integral membrane protein n=1 Tax=Halalkalibacter hemicellulosilyticusJCM 9152 TaxID=1236971 RepID=W4QDN4_9BACI|nr:DUF1129 family protein [Halalkalibacter hemicellulosilyticus]GAE29798.1 hypothetical protein JCM9152_1182 [Halalkalibacter hemicellulosilyticusJCM 9152]
MKTKELVKQNNEKRKELTKENRNYYEDMLIYIRLSYNKSEEETEVILTELLDHLLEAQNEGREAEDVFGHNPKEYANEIIGELPKMVTRERILFGVMALLYFLTASILFFGIYQLIGHFFLNIDGLTKDYYIGTVLVKTTISIPIAFLLLVGIVQYIRWACFKKINKILEFMLTWLVGILSIGIFILAFIFIPDFGPVVSISVYVLFVLGAVWYVIADRIRKAI